MCPAFCCGREWPLTLMGTVERGLIIAAGSHCPMTRDRFFSFVGLTDRAITRVHPRKPPAPAAVDRSGGGWQTPEVLLTHHQSPSDARHLVGEHDGHQLARLGGEQLCQPRVVPCPL